MGTHVVPVEIVGVDPRTEPSTNRFVRNVSQGRYLQSSDTGAVVIGQAIADRLVAGLDDEILATAVGKSGDIESMLLRIVGIVRTGSDEIDATICQVVLADVERLTGLSGAGEVTLILDDWERADAAKAALSQAVGAGDEVLTWGEISPEFKGHLEQDNAVSRLVSGIILLIVVLGVASAQLAAVLERRREFAVLVGARHAQPHDRRGAPAGGAGDRHRERGARPGARAAVRLATGDERHRFEPVHGRELQLPGRPHRAGHLRRLRRVDGLVRPHRGDCRDGARVAVSGMVRVEDESGRRVAGGVMSEPILVARGVTKVFNVAARRCGRCEASTSRFARASSWRSSVRPGAARRRS